MKATHVSKAQDKTNEAAIMQAQKKIATEYLKRYILHLKSIDNKKSLYNETTKQ